LVTEAKKTSVQGIIAALEGMKIRKNHLYTLQNCRYSLVVLGEKDPVLDCISLGKTLDSYGIVYRSVSGGHMSIIEQKSETVSIIKHFLKGFPSLSC
jgi:hypothetical protein